MAKAVRAIIIENGKVLVMRRNKYGSEYFTLVGGVVNESETLEQALAREVREETGLEVTQSRLVFTEEHPSPYNQQYVFLCSVAPHDSVGIQTDSEEGFLNKLDANIHTPLWVEASSFGKLAFRTPQLQTAIIQALKQGFPNQPVKL